MRLRRRLRRLKRLTILGLVIVAVVTVRRARARRVARPTLGPPASWPPLVPSEPPVAAAGGLADEPHAVHSDRPPAGSAPLETGESPVAAVGLLAGEDPAWVAPVEGDCPVSHPVKANDNSGIYHVPGGRFYDRTQPERCYRDAAAAEADGYRAAKGS